MHFLGEGEEGGDAAGEGLQGTIRSQAGHKGTFHSGPHLILDLRRVSQDFYLPRSPLSNSIPQEEVNERGGQKPWCYDG